jgi:hypothetical protein
VRGSRGFSPAVGGAAAPPCHMGISASGIERVLECISENMGMFKCTYFQINECTEISIEHPTRIDLELRAAHVRRVLHWVDIGFNSLALTWLNTF